MQNPCFAAATTMGFYCVCVCGGVPAVYVCVYVWGVPAVPGFRFTVLKRGLLESSLRRAQASGGAWDMCQCLKEGDGRGSRGGTTQF